MGNVRWDKPHVPVLSGTLKSWVCIVQEIYFPLSLRNGSLQRAVLEEWRMAVEATSSLGARGQENSGLSVKALVCKVLFGVHYLSGIC